MQEFCSVESLMSVVLKRRISMIQTGGAGPLRCCCCCCCQTTIAGCLLRCVVDDSIPARRREILIDPLSRQPLEKIGALENWRGSGFVRYHDFDDKRHNTTA